MDRRDRERIDHYCGRIVPKIEMTKLFPKLLENKVYNRDDINILRWKKTLREQKTVKDIYLTVKTRGPNAFKNLLVSLRQSDHGNIADILEGKNTSSNIRPNTANNSEEQNNNASSNERREDPVDHIVWSDEPLTIKLCKAIKFLDREPSAIQRYPMRSKPRGFVLIISNIYYNSPHEKPRLSAKHDEDNLKELFEEMGFNVIVHQNLTGLQIKETVEKFSMQEDLEKVDSCFVFITSHGTEDEMNNTEIQGTDYHSGQANTEKVLCSDIYDYFTAEACPKLAEKPKIFVFQLCRGKKVQKAIVTQSRVSIDSCVIPNTSETDEFIRRSITTRNYSDMLVIQSTLPGHVAYRDKITGSWFIQILCKVFMNHACTDHIQDLFNMIDAQLKYIRAANNECQTSTVKSMGFNKHCYLNPGLFEDEPID